MQAYELVLEAITSVCGEIADLAPKVLEFGKEGTMAALSGAREAWQSDAAQELRGVAWSGIAAGSSWAKDGALAAAGVLADAASNAGVWGMLVACCACVQHGLRVEDIVNLDIVRDFVQYMSLFMATIAAKLKMFKAPRGHGLHTIPQHHTLRCTPYHSTIPFAAH